MIDGLTFSRRERRLLDGISLSLASGEIVVLVGPNGSGKSTLLRCIAGALTPQAGTIRVGPRALNKSSATERATLLSYAPQETPFAFAFTVAEFIGLSSLHPPTSLTHEERRTVLLEQFDLTHLQHRSLLTLSGGERQRASIVRSLLQETPYLLLDEPTSHLDLRHQKQLLHVLRTEARDKKRGILVVLHDLNLAASVADTIALLNEGRLTAVGKPMDVLTAAHIQDVYRTDVRIDTVDGQPVLFLSH